MTALEWICLGIVLVWVAPRARLDPAPGKVLLRLLLIAVAAWLGEASCIRLYGFYGYEGGPWGIRLPGGVPLLVPLIWPVVIHSSWDLARRLLPVTRPVARVLTCAGIVLADAALIEPVAVHAGLWSWTEPGLFAVPPVGVLGWAAFTVFAAAVLEVSESTKQRSLLGLLLLTPLLIHPVLLALWWGALRWINGTVPPEAAIAVAALTSLVASAWIVKARPRAVRWPTLARAPGALFFLGLLITHPPTATLLAWVVVFVPPYLALMAVGSREPSS